MQRQATQLPLHDRGLKVREEQQAAASLPSPRSAPEAVDVLLLGRHAHLVHRAHTDVKAWTWGCGGVWAYGCMGS